MWLWGGHWTPEASLLKCKVPEPSGLLWECKSSGSGLSPQMTSLAACPSQSSMARNIQDKVPMYSWIFTSSCFSSLWIAHLMRSLIDGQCSLPSQQTLTNIFLDSMSSWKKENLAAINNDKRPLVHPPHTAARSLLWTSSYWTGRQWSYHLSWVLLWSDLSVN